MKLAIVIPGFQSSAGDWCIPAFTNLARELSKHVEVHVFALRYPHRRDRYLIGDVWVHSFGGAPFGGRRYPVASTLRLWREAQQAVAVEHRNAPFTAVLGIWATESGWLATRIGQRLHVRTVVHLAGGELASIPQIGYGNWGRGVAGWMVRRTLRSSSTFTVPSGEIARQLLVKAPGASRKSLRWPLGVDTAMFPPQNDTSSGNVEPECAVSNRPFTFIAVGSLIPVKGFDLLLDGFARFMRGLDEEKRRDVRLKIVGDGPLLGQLQRQVNDLDLYSPLQGYVSFEGAVAHDKLPRLYNESDCFVCTSWHEAQCMAALEAMSCGLPWVGLPVGALGDVVRLTKQPSGITVASRSSKAIAEGLARIHSMSPEERGKLGENARRIVLKEYDLKAQVARLLLITDPSIILYRPPG